MFSVIECPSCELQVRLPESAIGKTVRCPQCNNTFIGEAKPSAQPTSEAPPPSRAKKNDFEEDFEVVGSAETPAKDRRSSRRRDDDRDEDDDRDDRRRTSSRDRDRDRGRDDDRPRRRTPARDRDDYDDDDYRDELRNKRRKRKKSGNTGLIIFGVIGILLAAAGAVFLVIWGLNSLFDKNIPESEWETVEVAGRFKGKLPGKPKEQSQDLVGLTQKMWINQPNSDAVYIISYTEGQLPAHRRNLPVEQLLNDACNGAVANTPSAIEESRKSINKDGVPGKELVMNVPKGKGKMIAQVYILNGRLYMLLTGGKGFKPDDKNVRQFFDYFQITEKPN